MNEHPELQNQQKSSKTPSTQQQNSSAAASPVKQCGNIFLCQERFEGRKSPELFREPFPAAWDSNREYLSTKSREERERQNARFRTELDPDDVKLVNELGHLSADKLMDYVRTLQTTSLQLSEEESAQFARAKLLKILDDVETEK